MALVERFEGLHGRCFGHLASTPALTESHGWFWHTVTWHVSEHDSAAWAAAAADLARGLLLACLSFLEAKFSEHFCRAVHAFSSNLAGCLNVVLFANPEQTSRGLARSLAGTFTRLCRLATNGLATFFTKIEEGEHSLYSYLIFFFGEN